MNIEVKIFSCNWETYKKVYIDAITRAYKSEEIEIVTDNIKVTLIKLDGNTIQSQRRPSGEHSRTILVYDNNILKYIIGFSNTGYDEDRRIESEQINNDYEYGNDNWHSNSYLCQGINKIFSCYYDNKKIYPGVKLFFYLLDTKVKPYPSNLSNLINYRKLATIGFDILNLDEISFQKFKELGFSLEESYSDIKYISFNKFSNDIAFLSRKNAGNMPSYLKCIDLDFKLEENENFDEEKFDDKRNEKYIYTFKTLGAEAYDSFLTMWTLHKLAKNENKNLEFAFAKEKWNFRLGQKNIRYTTDFPSPITSLFNKIGLDIKYETSDEVRQQFERENYQYKQAKRKQKLRNQELFKNNMRMKGVQTKCYLCGCEIENILEAAHLWGVHEIKKASKRDINIIVSNPNMTDLIDKNNPHHQELFYKKYVLANSGDNGVWLCSNHHGLFDNNYYCFESTNGKVIIKFNATEESKEFFNSITHSQTLPKEILTSKTKIFLTKREELFKQKLNTKKV